MLSVFFLEARPRVGGGGCVYYPLEKFRVLCLPSFQYDFTGSPEGPTRQGQRDTGGSVLAQPALVSSVYTPAFVVVVAASAG